MLLTSGGLCRIDKVTAIPQVKMYAMRADQSAFPGLLMQSCLFIVDMTAPASLPSLSVTCFGKSNARSLSRLRLQAC